MFLAQDRETQSQGMFINQIGPVKCKKYGMEWSDKTCHTPYQKPFKIKDREIQFGSKIVKL